MASRAGLRNVSGSVVFLLALLLPGFLVDRTETFVLLASYVLAFGAYLALWNSSDLRALLTVGLLARIGLFFCMPMLSDDVYRFLWDGYLLKAGIHPFAELPGFYLNQGISGLSQELFDSLNSQKYFTVYPPINQGIFWLSVVVSDNWLVSAGVIRVFLLAADVVTFYFIRKILRERGGNQNLAFLFFLNPLVILEGVGNLHFEVMVCSFLAIGIHYFFQKKTVSAGAGFGMAIGTKLLPFIYLPYFFFEGVRSKKILMTVCIVLVAGLSMAPLLNATFIDGLRSSLGLYFTNFEFNGSLFRIAREISVEATGYNKIKILGPIFSIVSATGILVVSFFGARRNRKVETILLSALMVYLAFSTTVHPWYILPLILFGILSGYVFPIIWSLMIFITYAGYSAEGYSLHWFWIALEYIIVVLSFIFNDRIKRWLTISS